jgi:hypothetical protein
MSADAADSKAVAPSRSAALATWTARLKPALGSVLLADLIGMISEYLLIGTDAALFLTVWRKSSVLIGSVESGAPLQTLRHRRRRCERVWSIRSVSR